MRLVMGSRPLVGSSYITTSGSSISARASPTRLRMPPESSLGYFDPAPSRPSTASFSRTLSRISRSLSFVCSRSGKATLSSTFHRIEQGRILEDHAEALSDTVELAFGKLGDVEVVDANAPAGRTIEPDEDLEEGGFSGARAPDDDRHVPARNRHVDVREGHEAPKAFLEPFDDDVRPFIARAGARLNDLTEGLRHQGRDSSFQP